ncbi:MAG: type II secretion system protein [Planctomycetota bacterium]
MGCRPERLRAGTKDVGFTIVELLIVTAMIIVLASILVVAIAGATRTSQRANSRALMNAITQALVRFKDDIGYHPPVLAVDRDLVDPPNPTSGSYVDEVQDWFSATTLAEYLTGYGHHNQDGYGVIDPTNANDVYTQERPRSGVRHPGTDGVWGATFNGAADGSLGARMAGSNPTIDVGKVYGPYLELKEERLLASTDGTLTSGNLNVFFPGEGNYDPDDPKVIVDYWGRPIRYYRQIYPVGAISSRYYPPDLDGDGIPDVETPTLSDVFVLRPFDLEPGSATNGIPDLGPLGDTSTTYALRSARFALFSAGPDRSLDADVRRDDPDELNRDNIVEVGQ